MKAENRFSGKRMGVMILLMLISDLLLCPISVFPSESAKSSFFIILLCAPAGYFFMYVIEKIHTADMASIGNYPVNRNGKPLALSGLVFLIAGADAIYRIRMFCQYISKPALQPYAFNFILFMTLMYAVYGGITSLYRMTSFLMCITGISLFLVIFSNIDAMHLYHMIGPEIDSNGSWIGTVFSITVVPELLIPLFLPGNKEARDSKTVRKSFPAFCIIYLILLLSAKLTMGIRANEQMHTIHTLSRLGGISVLRRLDAVFSGVWVIAGLFRITAFLSMAQNIISAKICRKNSGLISAAVVSAAGLAASGLIHAENEKIYRLLIAAGVLMIVLRLFMRDAAERSFHAKNNRISDCGNCDDICDVRMRTGEKSGRTGNCENDLS